MKNGVSGRLNYARLMGTKDWLGIRSLEVKFMASSVSLAIVGEFLSDADFTR